MTRGDQIRLINVLNQIEHDRHYALGYNELGKQTVAVKFRDHDGTWSAFVHITDGQLKDYVKTLFHVYTDRIGQLNMAMCGI